MEQGINLFMTHEEYHKDPCPVPSLSRSTIKDLNFKTPRHAWENHPRLNPDYEKEEKGVFDLGSAAHSLFLEGIDKAVPLDFDDWRKKEAQIKRDALRTNGLYPLLKKQYADVEAMVFEAQRFIAASELRITDLYKEFDSEISCFWEEGGIWFRTRPDLLSKDRKLIIDYKTTGQLADPNEYDRIILATGLDIQDALYTHGVQWLCDTQPRFVFLIQETSSPYLCSLLELSYVYQEMGAEKIERAANLWAECLSSNIWPGYTGKVVTLSPPTWVLQKWEERKELDKYAV